MQLVASALARGVVVLLLVFGAVSLAASDGDERERDRCRTRCFDEHAGTAGDLARCKARCAGDAPDGR